MSTGSTSPSRRVPTSVSSLPAFDPRNVPIAGIDTHLPAVHPERLSPRALQQRFAHPPHWQPDVVLEKRFTDRDEAHAAVLVPIVVRGSQLTVLLTQRPSHMTTHAGQIAFPGGKSDPSDLSPAATALREAQEEVGLAHDYVEVMGQLPTYITGTAFVVTPVVALVHPGFTLTTNPVEVADVFEVPLEFLMNPANHRRHVVQWQGVRREWFSMPYVDRELGVERFIWGATAGMLRNFYRFLAA